MKNLTIFSLMVLFLGTAFVAQAQSNKYVGEWTLTKSPLQDKCGQDQVITLRKDGTASYQFGANTPGCKSGTRQFKTWEVRKTKSKKTAIVIGQYDDIIFVIEKEKGKTIHVATDVVSGDTTTDMLMVFQKQ